MPISYVLQDDLLVFKAKGEVTVKDFYSAWDDIKRDPEFHVPLDTLIDLREAHIDVPGEELDGIVHNLKNNRFFTKMVFVAERGSFTYAMGRMFCINAECAGCCAEIFLDIVEAMDWLNSDSANRFPFPAGMHQ